jgi:hypothetical protein
MRHTMACCYTSHMRVYDAPYQAVVSASDTQDRDCEIRPHSTLPIHPLSAEGAA